MTTDDLHLLERFALATVGCSPSAVRAAVARLLAAHRAATDRDLDAVLHRATLEIPPLWELTIKVTMGGGNVTVSVENPGLDSGDFEPDEWQPPSAQLAECVAWAKLSEAETPQHAPLCCCHNCAPETPHAEERT